MNILPIEIIQNEILSNLRLYELASFSVTCKEFYRITKPVLEKLTLYKEINSNCYLKYFYESVAKLENCYISGGHALQLFHLSSIAKLDWLNSDLDLFFTNTTGYICDDFFTILNLLSQHYTIFIKQNYFLASNDEELNKLCYFSNEYGDKHYMLNRTIYSKVIDKRDVFNNFKQSFVLKKSTKIKLNIGLGKIDNVQENIDKIGFTKIDCVFTTYNNIQTLLDDFDLSICSVAMKLFNPCQMQFIFPNFESKKAVISKSCSYRLGSESLHNLERKSFINPIHFKISQLNIDNIVTFKERVKKYKQRGFKITQTYDKDVRTIAKKHQSRLKHLMFYTN
jgi:hypothetical protein